MTMDNGLTPMVQSASQNWQTVTLGDCVVTNDAIYSPNEAWPFVNYLDTGNITENRISEIQNFLIDEGTLPSRARRKVQLGDIVYSTVRPNQRHFGRIRDVPKNFLASTGFAVMRGRPETACTEYIYWFLAQDHVVEYLQTIAESSTSAYPSIRPADLEQLELSLPPLPEQRRIADILCTLDDKIELNRRMNETLEQIARALYKSWFVDFDPVRAKLDGLWRRGESLPGLPAELYDLFPDHLVTSELGEIPDGWTVGVLANMVQLFSGGTPKTSVAEYWNGNIPWYTAKDAPALSDVFAIDTERHISQSGVDNSATQVLPARTTIISARGTVGRLACLGEPMAMNQTCYGIRGIDKYPDWFTYWNVRQAISELQMRTHGTIFDTITRQTFELVDAVVPPPVLAAIFETMVSPYMSRMLASLRDSRRVAYLRDALLPRLVSGKLRVAEPNVTEPV